ncbi:hypothetical protein [Micromonospora peucetia]|uniref:Uncharacterized protein n=1 Tax=Micromonospora peucetia TaxID=47871 RepID=A0A1C6VTZ2_9ACTN|nr:hypothetical protein [Micromonospora peucetia]SCL69765.1 hypothetical protein GA0070608_4126 [Micromonospora peucetia]
MAIDLRVADNRDVSFLVQADLHVDRQELHGVIEVGRVTVAVEDTFIQGALSILVVLVRNDMRARQGRG